MRALQPVDPWPGPSWVDREIQGAPGAGPGGAGRRAAQGMGMITFLCGPVR